MAHRTFWTLGDQVSNLLREGMLSGRWRGTLPGRERLAQELGVSHKTVEAAMRQLAAEGLLVSQGSGQRRRIVLPEGGGGTRELRVRILLYDKQDAGSGYNQKLLDQLHQAGFSANYALKTLNDLGMDAKRVARFVTKTTADAWIVCSGSREVLEWFSQQSVPAIAMFGRFSGLPIAAASPRKSPALARAVRRLVALGHRRIVMLAREERRKPYPALFEANFLKELEAHGLATGSYNLPDWEESPAGFRAGLDALFQLTPPTALLLDEPGFFIAAQQCLARRGIHAPEHVSLICCDPNPIFNWCEPAISHLHWEHGPVVRRVVRWTKNVARGKDDRRQVFVDAEFFEGGTVGPVRL